MKIERQDFGRVENGMPVQLYTLSNREGMRISITNYGGIITSAFVPDRNGKISDVVLGYDRIEDYVHNPAYFGCIVGRVAGRIAGGQFELNGKTWTLAVNNGPNHLHGGLKGFNKKVWRAEELKRKSGPSLKLSYLSEDGEEGYPGNVSVDVIYCLTDESVFYIDYTLTTDRSTLCNLTNHTYFNLRDGGVSSIVDHKLMIAADRFAPIDEQLIPSGEIQSVDGTPLDFRHLSRIGARIDADHPQIRYGGGYDHYYFLNGQQGQLKLGAWVYEPDSGRILQVWTTEPGVQYYTGNFLNDTFIGKKGTIYGRRHGFCLETQHPPDAPHHPDFQSTVINPGETYRSSTFFQFLCDQKR